MAAAVNSPLSSQYELAPLVHAYTQKGTTGRIYVDGVEVASADHMTLSPRQVGDQVTFLGRNWGHPSFNGRLQDFRIHAGALSAGEIAALMQ